jgi:biopolymer transport protein ExbD
VLLIIFIILASITKEPKLPDAHNRDKVQNSSIVVLINDKSEIQLGSQTVTIATAPDAFKQLQTDTGLKDIIIKADPKSSYGVILQVMAAARQAGITDFGLANHIEGLPEGQSQ